jgi:hypothetical protein
LFLFRRITRKRQSNKSNLTTKQYSKAIQNQTIPEGKGKKSSLFGQFTAGSNHPLCVDRLGFGRVKIDGERKRAREQDAFRGKTGEGKILAQK